MPSSPAEIILPLTVVGGVAIWIVIASGRRTERMRRESQRFRRRQQQPDVDAFRRRYGCNPPAALRSLLEDRESFAKDRDAFEVVLPVTAGEYRWGVAWIEPLDEERLSAVRWPGTEGYYTLANDGAGDEYLIDPTGADPEVIYYSHETGKKTRIGVPLSCFLGARRRHVGGV